MVEQLQLDIDEIQHQITKAKARGKDEHSHHPVIVMSGNNGRTIAEVFNARTNGEAVKADNYEHWQKFGEWFAAR